MHIYAVGGFVRDKLLREEFGYPVPAGGDRDWVVTGADPETMIRLGYRPVGADFPVFLHPVTHEEYALARTERKTAPGYHGFVFHTGPGVTLEDDLRRRDLTVNAMALSDDGTLVDPWGGHADLERKVLRHVSDAFEEDPVRILRVARFAARFPDFTVAPETMELMRSMVRAGEADALVPERIWSEFFRAVAHGAPLRFVDILSECGLWAKILPEIPLPGAPLRAALDRAAAAKLPPESRTALLFSSAPDSQTVREALTALRAPAAVTGLAETFRRVLPELSGPLTVSRLASLLEKADALRRPERFGEIADAFGILADRPVPHLRKALSLWCGVRAGDVAARFREEPSRIPAAVREARVAALAELSLPN